MSLQIIVGFIKCVTNCECEDSLKGKKNKKVKPPKIGGYQSVSYLIEGLRLTAKPRLSSGQSLNDT